MSDAWLMTSPLGTPRERYDEYSSKVFPSVKKPRYVDQERSKQTTEGDDCKLRDSSGQFIWRIVQALLC
jgi:hypothetical protein